MFIGTDIGIDLGTSTVLVYVKGEGIVLNEPSVVAVDSTTHSVVAVGESAREMLGRTPDTIKAVRPLKEGVISDFGITQIMLKYFMEKAIGRHWFRKPRVAVCVPSKVTSVEKRAIQEATANAGAGQVFVIEEPIAAAIGAGIDISRACGSLVIDIGGGTADIAVISLGGNVVSNSLRTAGDDFDDAIIRYIRKRDNVIIGERTAEEIKITVGAVYETAVNNEMQVRGRSLVSGLPEIISITTDETRFAMEEAALSIVDAVKSVLEKTPPELSSDILNRGIVLTGGGSLITGMDNLIEEKTGIKTVVADDALQCVALGTGRFIEYQTQRRGFFSFLFR